MKVDSQKGLRSMQDALRRLEKNQGSSVDVGNISNKALRELARTVQTSCSSTVSIPRMKEALKTVGAEIRGADRNQDGQLDAREQRALSSLAARLLELATGVTVERGGGNVSTGCGSSTPSTPSRPVSTGCGSSVSTPSRPVSTGCGSSTNTPSRPTSWTPTPAPSRPVSTGCGSSSTTTPSRPIRTGC
ncbi:MAG: hypothetical protein AB2A00_26005 [Myxococcota bacterium]